jgi:hypothetical protein
MKSNIKSKESSMIIQSSHNLLTYNKIQQPSELQTGGNILPDKQTKSSSAGEQVTLSNKGKALAATSFDQIPESAIHPKRTPGQERMINEAKSNPEFAEKSANLMAYSRSMIAYDISESVNNDGPIKLSTTGRIVDESFTEFKEAFEKEAKILDAQRLALYKSEKAMGTDPSEILAKMIDFTNRNSSDIYREATGDGYFFK